MSPVVFEFGEYRLDDDRVTLTGPDGAEIAEAAIALGRGDVDREDLIERGLARAGTFSWKKAARAHLDVYNKVVE